MTCHQCEHPDSKGLHTCAKHGSPYWHIMATYDVELRGNRDHVHEVLRLVGEARAREGKTGHDPA